MSYEDLPVRSQGPQWRGARPYGLVLGLPKVGDVIPFDHILWRVIAVPENLDLKEGATLSLLSIEPDGSDPRHVELRAWPYLDVADYARIPSSRQRPRLLLHYPDPERYPICSCCRGPIPCRAELAARTAASEAARADRASQRAEMGACAACGEPVSQRQKSIVFDGPHLDAILSPGPVFHLRGRCVGAAMRYEKRWVAAEQGRVYRVHCPGIGRWHVDGWDCTEGAACPGAKQRHSDAWCCHDERCLRCKDARARGEVVAKPWPGWPLRARPARKPKPAVGQGYMVPAARLAAAVHVTDPARPCSPKTLRPPKGRQVVAQYPPGTVLGYTLCGLEMTADDQWVRYRGDPVEDGTACGDCQAKALREVA